MKIKKYYCKWCEKEFIKYNSTQKTCSQKCQDKLDEARAKEKRKIVKLKKSVSVSVLTKKLDSLWSECVKINFHYKCQYCGKWRDEVQIHSHHLFTRSRRATRWDIDNGIALCASHHTLSSEFSAHQCGQEFFMWLEELRWREWIETLSKKSQKIIKVTPDMIQEKIKEFELFKNWI